jgi:hypothetical protein
MQNEWLAECFVYDHLLFSFFGNIIGAVCLKPIKEND